jgi:[glutamine synthetase] adenylyltransferase / [glutamine synthetase]-adenylyl-L-tyrosine phosphorylase
MESLRQFKQTQQLKIAAADATQVLDIKKVSDHLTALAEAIIEQAVNIAWQHMVKRYGSPTGADEAHKGFAIIAYGKAGGYELGYDSDLDLVFVHNSQGEQYTTGKKVISSRQFYLKLAQRLMHLFNTRTASGILYELDTRLRPEGNSGLLAINIESFFNYQQNEAWTWEHQALVRARMVFGETQLYQRFNVIRAEILRQQREPQTLKEDVIKMREKMRQHLAKDSDELFDLKQGYGGMADIEFITQYLVLNYSYSTPCLSEYTDNIRILDIAEKSGVINTQQQQDLTHTYCVLREYYHFNSLNKEGRCIAIGEIKKSAKNVRAIWEKIFW